MASGLVTVNGRTVTELGTKADVARDHIKVAGRLIRLEPERVYIALHKPAEVVATMSDPEGRRSLRDLLHKIPQRVFPAGRMEYHASGLILLTNDGDLTNRILRAHDLPQAWHVKLKSLLTFANIESLARATRSRIARMKGKETPWYEITLSEARRDALRNRLQQMGNPVEKMKRVALANIELGHLAPGAHREISPSEIAGLIRTLDGEKVPRPSARPDRARKRPARQTKKKLL